MVVNKDMAGSAYCVDKGKCNSGGNRGCITKVSVDENTSIMINGGIVIGVGKLCGSCCEGKHYRMDIVMGGGGTVQTDEEGGGRSSRVNTTKLRW